MKKLSSMDLNFLTGEFKEIEGGRLDIVYEEGKRDFILQFYVPGKGKKLLKVSPYAVYFVNERKDKKEAGPYALLLRKRLKNARLNSISQVKSERILELTFSSKAGDLALFLELFSRGNIILCKDDLIIAPLEGQEWSTRKVRKGEKYDLPPPFPDILSMSIEEFRQRLLGSEGYDLARALALDFGLGGLYSEELCLISAISKLSKPRELSGNEIELLYTALSRMIKSRPEPVVVFEHGKVVDALPFMFRLYEGKKAEPYAAFSGALEFYYDSTTEKTENRSVARLMKAIEEQEELIEKWSQTARESSEKGDAVYSNYALIMEIIEGINTARKKYSWDEIKIKLKGHKYIREINEKSGKITVEIQ